MSLEKASFMKCALKYLKSLVWAVPGFLLWASFPPHGEKMDVLFALVPLLWTVRRGDVRKAARTCFFAGLVFWIATLSWMPAIVKNGGPLPLVLLGWGALGAYCALYFGAFGFLAAQVWRWARAGGYARRLGAILVAEPILWAGLELVRSRLGGGFAWNQLGVPLVNAGFGACAALGGVYLVSACVVLINGTFVSIAERMLSQLLPGRVEDAPGWQAMPRTWRSIETFLPLALVLVAFKAVPPLRLLSNEVPGVSVALVQRNFPCVFDRERARRENPADIYARLLGNIAPLKPDLVVLPESALAEFGTARSRGAAAFASAALDASQAKALLAGGTRLDGTREYNSAVLFTASEAPRVGAQGLAVQIYDKNHLVPFGEYIPGDKTFPALQKLAPVGSCTPGELTTLDFGETRLGVAICFEDTDSAHVRRLAEKGANLLAFITNDSWFAQSVEAEQHAWQAVARAIETGLSVVRVGNSGVTGVISPNGVFAYLTDDAGRALVDEPGTMVERLETPRVAPTPYVRFGDKPLFVLFALLVAAIALSLLSLRRQPTGDVRIV